MIYHLLEYFKYRFNKHTYEIIDDLWLYYVTKTLSEFVPSTSVVIIDIHDHLIYSNLSNPSGNSYGSPLLISESVDSIV
jgi:hypothetical protein